MSQDIELRCRCGEVHGVVKDVSPQTVNRAICYCDDCQAFAHYLGRSDVLDACGGSDVVQVAPAALVFDRGAEKIVGMRLTAKGLYRFHTACCKTPMGNTLAPQIPFVGLVVQVFGKDAAATDALFGKASARVFGKFALGAVPDATPGLHAWTGLRFIARILGWRIGGKASPNPYFDRATKRAWRPITVLSHGEREALRPLCGPNARPA